MVDCSAIMLLAGATTVASPYTILYYNKCTDTSVSYIISLSTSGLSQAACLRCDAGSSSRHHGRLLAHGVGEQLGHHCDAHAGARGGEGSVPQVLARGRCRDIWCVPGDRTLSQPVRGLPSP